MYGADYNLEILGQKWRALRNHLALRNRRNLVLGKNNQVAAYDVVRFSELLLKIPDGFRGWWRRRSYDDGILKDVGGKYFLQVAFQLTLNSTQWSHLSPIL